MKWFRALDVALCCATLVCCAATKGGACCVPFAMALCRALLTRDSMMDASRALAMALCGVVLAYGGAAISRTRLLRIFIRVGARLHSRKVRCSSKALAM